MILSEMKRMNIGIMDMAKSIGIPCYQLAEMLNQEKEMPTDIKGKIKIFLIQNYTKCIEEM